MKHIAYSPNTGEVITTNRSFFHLLCLTHKESKFNKKHFSIKTKWIYAHGRNADKKIKRKIELERTRQKIRELTTKIHELKNKQKGGE